MIYQFGKNNQEGFSLLEVLVAVTIFAVAFTLLIKIQSTNIARIDESIKKLEGIRYFKEEFYLIPNRTIPEDRYIIKEKKEKIDFGINEITYTIIEKNTGKKIIEIKSYEK
ncbi:type IV pilus modification PilV family protein [Persephonella sp.]